METIQEANWQPSDTLEDYYHQVPSADPARQSRSHARRSGIELPDIEPDDTISDDPYDDIGMAKLAQSEEESPSLQQAMDDYYGTQDYWSTSSSPFRTP